MIPKEITKDSDTGIDVASFGYYEGLEYFDLNNIKQSTWLSYAKMIFLKLNVELYENNI